MFVNKQRFAALKPVRRHTRVDTVLSYIDDVEPFEDHAAERLLLSIADAPEPRIEEEKSDES